jgi:hypothetical protein
MIRWWLTGGVEYVMPDGRRFMVLSVDYDRSIVRIVWTHPISKHEDVHQAEISSSEIAKPMASTVTKFIADYPATVRGRPGRTCCVVKTDEAITCHYTDMITTATELQRALAEVGIRSTVESPFDFTVKFRRGALVNGRRGWDYEVSDHRGFVVGGAWTPGDRADAEVDAAAAVTRLRTKKARTAS